MTRSIPLTLLGAFLFTAGAPQLASAQLGMPPSIPVDPTMPVKEGFDVERAYLGRAPLFQPMYNPEWIPLREARSRGAVDDDTPILVFEAGGRTLALVSSQMSYHHVAQGEMAGEPWMVTF
ncbi:MAG: hypothetical protein RQ745_12300 [Longimicrobiales bacterium]|nr:hypothetical protein [Longimicrobiales bacterium]